MTLEQHLRRCYATDYPDTPTTIETAEEALIVYRSGYLSGLKDGQAIQSVTDALKARQYSQHEFNRGYAQGVAYAAFAASHASLPTLNCPANEYVIRLHAASLTRTSIVDVLQVAAKTARDAAI